jgi:18S rRNA (adenine1779-N6/adenine1780-N6)-dimethyltransferase
MPSQNHDSLFKQKVVLELLEKNFKTMQSSQLAQESEMGEKKMSPDDIALLANMVEDLSMETSDEKYNDEMEMEIDDGDVADERASFKVEPNRFLVLTVSLRQSGYYIFC